MAFKHVSAAGHTLLTIEIDPPLQSAQDSLGGLTRAPKLSVQSFRGTEELSSCFKYEVTLLSPEAEFADADLLGRCATVFVHTRDALGQPVLQRCFSGVICELSCVAHQGHRDMYRAVLRPWLWLLSLSTRSRIFKDMTTLDIVDEVIREWNLPELKFERSRSTDEAQYKPRRYCVQYAESDLAFISRLLEDEGIYFYFEHHANEHVLYFADAAESHPEVPGYEVLCLDQSGARQDHFKLSSWRSHVSLKPRSVVLRDYDYTQPRETLEVEAQRARNPDNPDVTAGTSVEQTPSAATIHLYPGGYADAKQGDLRAQRALEALCADQQVFKAETTTAALFAGARFSLLAGIPVPQFSTPSTLLVTSAHYAIGGELYASGFSTVTHLETHLRCIDLRTPYRPPRRTPRPVIQGVHTAKVVGGEPGSVATESEYGRIKLHFPWDRMHQYTDWVRVAQLWTGDRWGSSHIPRVGQEVLVQFIDGDPDRPIVIGSVYNQINALPFDQPTVSGFKTRSLHPNGQLTSDQAYQELSFDDTAGNEKLYIQAQRDMNTLVKNHQFTAVGGSDMRTVAEHVMLAVATGDHFTRVLLGKHVVQACTAVELVVGQCRMLIEPSGITLSAPNTSVTLSDSGIRLKAGAGVVDVNKRGVTLSGPHIIVNS